ncbi:MAG: molybdopterin cofactor-binding domain-containing protein, partial [Bacteroidota bacterium]
MSKTKNVSSRRNFLIKFSLGTGVMVGLAYASCNPMRRMMFDNLGALISDYAPENGPTTWFEITAENKIILHSPKVEMGQGVFTALAQLAAEELEVEIDKIEVVHATTAGRPMDPRSTGGSDSVSSLWNPLRELAAKMRQMLLNNAAQIMGVSVASLSIDNGVITGKGKSMTYGEVVQQATTWEEPKEVTLKKEKDFNII